MNKHTPGPWFVDRNHAGKIMGVASPKRMHDLEFVAECQDEASAHLIAAAPELLIELKSAVFQYEKLLAKTGGKDYCDTIEDARKVIAKAEGLNPQNSADSSRVTRAKTNENANKHAGFRAGEKSCGICCT